jgi:hypothetical protein
MISSSKPEKVAKGVDEIVLRKAGASPIVAAVAVDVVVKDRSASNGFVIMGLSLKDTVKMFRIIESESAH